MQSAKSMIEEDIKRVERDLERLRDMLGDIPWDEISESTEQMLFSMLCSRDRRFIG